MSFFWHSPRLSLPEQTGGFFSCLSIIPHFFEKCKGFCKIFFQPHDFFYFCIWKRCWLQKMSHLFEILFPITSRRQTKSFSVQQFFKNAAEVWASSPHLRSKFNFVVWFSCCNCLRLEICSLSHKNSVRSAVHSCVRQICTCSADTPANNVNAVTIKFGLTLSGCPTDNIHSSTNAPTITCSA